MSAATLATSSSREGEIMREARAVPFHEDDWGQRNLHPVAAWFEVTADRAYSLGVRPAARHHQGTGPTPSSEGVVAWRRCDVDSDSSSTVSEVGIAQGASIGRLVAFCAARLQNVVPNMCRDEA